MIFDIIKLQKLRRI